MKDIVRTNFDASVSAYDAYEAHTGRFAALARLLRAEMERLAPAALDTVLDAGAGSGVSTRVFAETAARTVALDISRNMLLANDAPDRVEGDFEHLPFPDDTFDGIGFTASLFLVPDPALAVGEARRVCRPGGVVGAVAPMGWVTGDGDDAFATLDRDSRSPTGADEVAAALADSFAVETGTWRFATTAEDIKQFHTIPAMAARLYPKETPEERVRKAEELVDTLEGTYEQRWRWVVGVADE